MNIYLKSGLIDNVSPKFGDIKCDWKNKLLSLWKELLIFGDGSLRWLNGPDTLNIFEWLFGLKLFSVLPGIFTGADVPCKRPIFVETFSTFVILTLMYLYFVFRIEISIYQKLNLTVEIQVYWAVLLNFALNLIDHPNYLLLIQYQRFISPNDFGKRKNAMISCCLAFFVSNANQPFSHCQRFEIW